MTPFSLTAIDFQWLPILPLITIAIAAIVVLLVGVRVPDDESDGLGWLSIASLAIAFVLTLAMSGQNATAFSGSIAIDDFAVYFQLAILFVAAMIVLMSLNYVDVGRLPGAEYYSLILFAALGMMLMAAAGDLIIIFIGLETMSIAIYVLAGLKRTDPRSNEAAIKYFLLGAFSMTVGNVVALVQTNIKRMLAYSAIAHAGYLLVAMAAAAPLAGAAMLFFLGGYVVGDLRPVRGGLALAR